jgi:glycosyltransferase involved in cell wall biosynthesis
VDVEEFLTMCTAGFPEPKTFSTRVARLLEDRVDEFDVVHDNQVLGYGILDIAAAGLPVVATIHHPITFDRRVDLAAAPTLRKKLTTLRWHGFLRMQGRVARRLRTVLTPSESSARDVVTDFGVDPSVVDVIPLGVDDVFRPPTTPRIPGRIVAMASADAPMKGIATLLEAFAKLRTERDVELLLVTRPQPGGRTEKLIEKLSIADSVRFVHGITDAELVQVMGSADVACVPSLYEGFSLPTAELMACETPLVVSRAGAIPEVVGPDGVCADLVEPGKVDQLRAALESLLDDPERRARMGRAGRLRVLEKFSWRAVAVATAAAYQRAVDEQRRERGLEAGNTEKGNADADS